MSRTPPDTGGLLRRAVPVVWLVIVWVLLWGTFSWANVLGGLAVGLLVLFLFPLPAAPGGGWIRPGAALGAAARFVGDLVVSSLQVAWQSLQAVTGPPIRSSVIAVRLESSSEFVMAMVTEVLTLVPGSVVIEARPEERTIYAHVLGAGDAAGRRGLPRAGRPARGRHRGGPRPTGRADRPRGSRRRRGEPMSTLPALLDAVLVVSLVLLGLSAVLVVVRLLRGPTGLDRLVALDVLVAEFLCGLVAYAALTGDSSLVPVVVAISLVGFLGSTTVARFVRRGTGR